MADKKGGGKEGWFSTGAEGAKKAKEADEEAKKRRELKGAFPFHLKNDEDAKVTYLDTPSFFFKQHTIKLGKDKYVTETCIGDFDDCPLCEVKDAAYVVAGTVIDHREFETTRDGKKVKVKNMKRPIIFKSKARENILREIKDEKGDISRGVYRMSRGSGMNECATGKLLAA